MSLSLLFSKTLQFQLNLNLDDDLTCDLILVKILLEPIVSRFKFKLGLDLDSLVY